MPPATSSDLLHKIYKSRTTILEVMESNGYDVSEYSEFNFLECNAMFQTNSSDMLLERPGPNKNKVFIKYMMEFKANMLQPLIEDLYEVNKVLTTADTLVIITNKNVTSDTIESSVKLLFDQSHIHVIIFDLAYLQFNGLKHKMVPKGTILSDQEADAFCREYNVSDRKKQLPEIDRFDPQAKLLCVRPGQIVHFRRFSQTALETDYWRVCV